LRSIRELNERYTSVFNKPDTDSDEGFANGNRLFERFGWIVTLDQMAGGDETKYAYYEGLNVIHFLNMLTFRIEKNAEQERLNELERLKRR
jgi:hypothetical protein